MRSADSSSNECLPVRLATQTLADPLTDPDAVGAVGGASVVRVG